MPRTAERSGEIPGAARLRVVRWDNHAGWHVLARHRSLVVPVGKHATDFNSKVLILQTDCFTLPPTGTTFYFNDNLPPVIPGANKSVCAP
jgi:hypothetical protein